MKTINLFLKMHFTSLSPDGQCISLAIVSDDCSHINDGCVSGFTSEASKSFYAEFTDFDVNRCDDWAKENVVSKLNINLKYKDPRENVDCMSTLKCDWKVKGEKSGIKFELSRWLSQFSGYKLNFIVDCGWFNWYKFVELMGEWETKCPIVFSVDCAGMSMGDIDELKSIIDNPSATIPSKFNAKRLNLDPVKTGLPKLPANFPPIPQDLNELILRYIQKVDASKTVTDAFDVDRENFLYIVDANKHTNRDMYKVLHNCYILNSDKYNALWDAKVTKEIYNNLV